MLLSIRLLPKNRTSYIKDSEFLIVFEHENDNVIVCYYI